MPTKSILKIQKNERLRSFVINMDLREMGSVTMGKNQFVQERVQVAEFCVRSLGSMKIEIWLTS